MKILRTDEQNRIVIADDDDQDLGALNAEHAIEFGRALVKAGEIVMGAKAKVRAQQRVGVDSDEIQPLKSV